LPAAIVNGGGDSFGKWKDFQLSRARDLDLGSTSTNTPNFIEVEETFCEWTDVRTDGHLRPTSLGRLRRVDLKLQHKMPQISSADLLKNCHHHTRHGREKCVVESNEIGIINRLQYTTAVNVLSH